MESTVHNDHTVVGQGALDRDLAPGDVAHDLFVRAVQWVAPAATAGGTDPDDLAGSYGLVVGQGIDGALVGPTGIDDDAERSAGPPAPYSPARQHRTVGDGHEARVAQHPDVLVVAESAAMASRTAGVHRQAQPLDHERPARLGELDRDVARVRDDVDGVLTVGVPAPAGA